MYGDYENAHLTIFDLKSLYRYTDLSALFWFGMKYSKFNAVYLILLISPDKYLSYPMISYLGYACGNMPLPGIISCHLTDNSGCYFSFSVGVP